MYGTGPAHAALGLKRSLKAGKLAFRDFPDDVAGRVVGEVSAFEVGVHGHERALAGLGPVDHVAVGRFTDRAAEVPFFHRAVACADEDDGVGRIAEQAEAAACVGAFGLQAREGFGLEGA